MDVLPVVMCRNEERWIEHVLRPLWMVFGVAIVGDTGSNDGTLPILRRLQNEGRIALTEYGLLAPAALGQLRKELAQQAVARGAAAALLVDGDEVYSAEALQMVADEGLPAGCTLSFTTGVLVDEDADGGFYELTPPVGNLNRTAIFLPTDRWQGEYPFESMAAHADNQPHHYHAAPDGFRYHYIHLHRCRRSTKDADVPLRVENRKRYCMQEIPGEFRGPAFDMAAWLAS
jgi:hypothetical protein